MKKLKPYVITKNSLYMISTEIGSVDYYYEELKGMNFTNKAISLKVPEFLIRDFIHLRNSQVFNLD